MGTVHPGRWRGTKTMATTTSDTTTTRDTAPSPLGDQCVVLRGVGWAGYSTLLRLRGERNRPKIVYLDGDVYLMSPAFAHEFLKKRLGHFVAEVVVGLDIPCIPSGETTFRRKKKKGGAEADESFYLTNLDVIAAKQGKEDIHLRRDPPPDLAIEAENTHAADAAVEVWRRFGVREVWVTDGAAVRVLTLQPDGSYAEGPASAVFPFLTAAEVQDWVTRPLGRSETDWIKAVRAWVRDVLAPRARGGA